MEDNETITECIDKLNSIITEDIKNYLKYFRNENYWKEFSFNDISSLDIAALSNNCGIYYIEINFNKKLNDFTNKEKLIKHVAEEWEKGSTGKCPKINKERMQTRNKEDYKNETWVSFYLGKSKKLNERLEEHLTGAEKGFNTYKLNLKKNTSELFKNSRYRIKTIEIEKLKGDKYYWVITRIESELREKLNPICGKQ